ncbi:MAG: 50S ribosomal protein L34e [Candidatus Woesearchaeota archaeon]
MPRPSRRSRTLRRIYVKTPKHTKLVYAKRKPKKAHCAVCKKVLPGVASERPYKLNKLSKTQKRPERPYAGVLCSACMRKTIKSNIVN